MLSAGGAALAILAGLAALAGCEAQVKNLQPARELARQTVPEGSTYLGWRVFQDRCARCHGAQATGIGQAPDLLARMADIGPKRFASLVLLRYDWDEAAARTRDDPAAREALLEQMARRSEPPLAMPAWQNEPRVNAHIVDLYAYLAARAEGSLGPGRPPGVGSSPRP